MGQISSVQISTVQVLNTYGVAKTELSGKYLQALKKGVPKPLKYVDNISINFEQPGGFTAAKFYSDDMVNGETDCLICEKRGNCYLDECWSSI